MRRPSGLDLPLAGAGLDHCSARRRGAGRLGGRLI